MTNALPPLGLLQDGRLEPSEALPDVAMFESFARRRSPLFDAELGLQPNRCFIVDTLHALYLDVFNSWCRLAVWHVLESVH